MELKLFHLKERKIKENGVIVEKYSPDPNLEITIPAIDLSTGKVEEKKIIEYSIHKNLKMYKVSSKNNKFKEFWVSEDHSLILYHSRTDELVKASPLIFYEINQEDKPYWYLVKLKNFKNIENGNCNVVKRNNILKHSELIPLTEVITEYDKNKTIGYDFTVEDYYTFCTSDGIFVQDTMAVYVPLTQDAKEEVEQKIWSYNQLLSPADGEIIFTPNQDVILGLYQLTRDDLEFEEHTTKVKYKGKEITLGRKIFNEILPEDYPLVDKTIGKKELMEILSDISRKYDKFTVGNIYDKIKDLGFKYSTTYPISLSLDGFDLGYDFEDKKRIFKSKDNKYENYIREEKELEKVKEKFPFKDLINSGARGNWTQVKQMVLSRGYVSDVNGKIINVPILSSTFEGLTEEEYFISCYGTRKGLIDTAENTSESGSLTRTLVFAANGCEYDKTVQDCKTKRTLPILVKDFKMLKALVGRYYIDENNKLSLISLEDKHLVGKTIKLRSPLFCRNRKGICRTCYGEHINIVNSKYIGVVAAQSLGEVTTQLVLRTFHLSGAALLRDDTGKQADIISDMKRLAGIFKGDFDPYTPEETILKLYSIYSNYKNIHLVHFEVILSQMIWAEIAKNVLVKARLVKDLEGIKLKSVSLKRVPVLEHWLLGCLYSNINKQLTRGLLETKEHTNIFTKLITGNILS